MTGPAEQFGGSIPHAYHQGLGPVIFEPYALDMGERLPLAPEMRVLETAAGTGLVTRALLARMPASGRLVATDLQEGMIGVGRAYVGDDPRLEWRPADAQALPFPDASFDALVCQFGLMFFPDKPLAIREAKRVLKPGGTLLLNVWDSFDRNSFARIANETLVQLFPGDPPPFFHTPFGYSDPATIRTLLEQAGLHDVRVEHVDKVAVSQSAEQFARGLILGTPVVTQIEARGGVDAATAVTRLTERLGELGGLTPHRSPMRALVATARA
jgi:SAM-dependent methyltransferase